MKKVKISIAKQFSKTPAGRFYDDGEYSGQRFRDEFLTVNLKNPDIDVVEIDLNGLDGIGSSFWDEAFAGLVFAEKIPLETLDKKLELVCDDDKTLIPLIRSYIKEAANG